MTITQLEYLIAVDRYKSFVDAADQCFVTQPTLSMQIQKLEEELNVLLFDRTKKPIVTTEIGRKVVDQALNIIRESKRVEEIIKDKKGLLEGELKIGIIPTISPYLTPKFLNNFIHKFPNIYLSIEELLSEHLIEKLQNGLIDVAIMIAPVKMNDLIKKNLYYEEFYLYVSNNHKYIEKEEIESDKLDTSDMWILKDGHCFRDQLESICEENFDTSKYQRVKFVGGSLETLRRLVDNNSGYTLLPEMATWEISNKSKQIKRFKGAKKPIREVSIVTHKSFLKKSMIDLFYNEVVNIIPSHLLNKSRGKVIDWSGPKN